jgi:hypothetical protein
MPYYNTGDRLRLRYISLYFQLAKRLGMVYANTVKEPSDATISKVMAALGRRNAGRPKAMTRREVAQRRNAARRSAAARRKNTLLRRPLAQPGTVAESAPNGATSTIRHLTNK